MSADDGPPRKIKQVSTREPRALVFVDVRNPVLIGSWDELGEGTTIPGPLNPGWGYSKRWKDSRDWDDDEEEEDACSEAEGTQSWEGSMSDNPEVQFRMNQVMADISDTIEPFTPANLPVVLAQMVNEYAGALDSLAFSQGLVDQFNTILLSAAQPLLTEHLARLLNPPMVYTFSNAGGETTTNGRAYNPEEDDELSALTKEWARIKSGRR